MDFPVEVSDLRKVFRQKKEERVAVDGVSFSVGHGEIFGLLGPNGAGKSTTIRMLSTLLEPTSGSVRICGFDTRQKPRQVRAHLGCVLTGERSTYWKMTAKENLEYFAAISHIPPRIARQRIAELLERFNLADRADDLVERFSSGMKQRLAIAKALLANPPVLLLDEPTVGLDPQSALRLRELILELAQDGHTIMLTTHYMEEADRLCDRIGIIDQGRIIALDTPENLKARLRDVSAIELELRGWSPEHLESVRSIPGVSEVMLRPHDDGDVTLTVHTESGSDLLHALLQHLAGQGAAVRQVRVNEPTLEDVFLSLTGRQLRE